MNNCGQEVVVRNMEGHLFYSQTLNNLSINSLCLRGLKGVTASKGKAGFNSGKVVVGMFREGLEDFADPYVGVPENTRNVLGGDQCSEELIQQNNMQGSISMRMPFIRKVDDL